MTLTPSELQRLGDAEDLLNAVCAASQTHLTDTQKTRALATLSAHLEALYHRWKAEWAVEMIDRLDREEDRG